MNAPTPSTPNWWTTMPGLLTGFAAILTAVGSIVAVLVQGGFIGSRAVPTQAATPSTASAAPAPPASPGPVVGVPAPTGTQAAASVAFKAVRVTHKSGSVVNLKPTSELTNGYFTLADGREVLYERLARIDIAQPWEGRVKLLLADGTTIDAEAVNLPLAGVTDLGEYIAMVADLRRIEVVR